MPLCIALVVASLVVGQAVTPPQQTGVISGSVVDGVSGAPLAGVYVQLVVPPGAQAQPRRVTDAEGRFTFVDLSPAEQYSITTTKVGYLDGAFGRRLGDTIMRRIPLAQGERRTDVVVAMWPKGSISGTVVDERGEGLVGVRVQAVRRHRISGQAHWVQAASTLTDDRGAYRFGGLVAGDFLVHVPQVQVTVPADASTLGARLQANTMGAPTGSTPAAAPPPPVLRRDDGTGTILHGALVDPTGGRAYVPTFHPAGLSVAQASVVTLSPGESRVGIDVQLVLARTVHVSGRVAGSPEAVGGLVIRLVPDEAAMMANADVAITTSAADGSFSFPNVPEGDYLLLAGRTLSNFSMPASVSLDRSIPGLVMQGMSNQMLGIGVQLSTQTIAGVDAMGSIPLSVGRTDVADVVVPVVTSVTVSGVYRMDDGSAVTVQGPVLPAVRLEAAEPHVSTGPRTSPMMTANSPSAGPPGAFAIPNVLPGRYVLGPMMAGSLTVVRAEAGGQDLMAGPLEVRAGQPITDMTLTLSAASTTVTGTAVTSRGIAASDAVVLVFPMEEALWPYAGTSSLRFRTASTGPHGEWRMAGMPPGRYYAAAVPTDERASLYDDGRLQALAVAATSFTLTLGAPASPVVTLQERR